MTPMNVVIGCMGIRNARMLKFRNMGSEMHGSYKFCAFSNSTIPINIDGFVVFQPLQIARF